MIIKGVELIVSLFVVVMFNTLLSLYSQQCEGGGPKEFDEKELVCPGCCDSGLGKSNCPLHGTEFMYTAQPHNRRPLLCLLIKASGSSLLTLSFLHLIASTNADTAATQPCGFACKIYFSAYSLAARVFILETYEWF